jgi:hypothetical protein
VRNPPAIFWATLGLRKTSTIKHRALWRDAAGLTSGPGFRASDPQSVPLQVLPPRWHPRPDPADPRHDPSPDTIALVTVARSTVVPRTVKHEPIHPEEISGNASRAATDDPIGNAGH